MADENHEGSASEERPGAGAVDTIAAAPAMSDGDTARVEPYDRGSAVRADIRDGDILMFRGERLLSRLISLGTSSPYSHAALAFREREAPPAAGGAAEERVFIVQATGIGVHTMLLSDKLATYPGVVELFRVTERFAPKFRPDVAITEARRYVGRPYAFGHLWRFLLDWLTFGLLTRARARARDRRAFFCSQLVARAYRRAGVDLSPRRGDAATAPADIILGRRVERVHVFARGDAVAAAPPA